MAKVAARITIGGNGPMDDQSIALECLAAIVEGIGAIDGTPYQIEIEVREIKTPV